ncbi:hypothetical protein ZIOFF_033545 [Zingiber officinale]|uniref:Uncharacterized protein n=1 Tax=Zingiber officinale TaxID=94328 RepID=A0A8J5L1V6_ZINOF|nr:hypothetical protein ZIOFF_033545 [Zingiber officinale]
MRERWEMLRLRCGEEKTAVAEARCQENYRSGAREGFSNEMGCENKFCRRLSSRKHRKLHLSLLAACCLISVTLYVRYSIIFPRLSSWLRNHAAPGTPPSGVISLDHQLGESVRRKQELKQGKVPLCDFSKRRSNVCELQGDIRIHGANSSVLVARPKDVDESRGS